MRHRIRLALGAVVSAALLGAGLATAAPALGATGPPEPVSLGGANLLSYGDSDIQSGTGNWASYSNATVSQDVTSGYLHGSSLLDVATAAGSTAYKLGGQQINVTASGKYRVWGYFRAPALSGRTITFAAGVYNSAGAWQGWTSSAAQTLNNSGGWQYVSAVITMPSSAAWVLGSPRVTEAGVAAGEHLSGDAFHFESLRAATLIGGHGDGNTAAAWVTANGTVGPMQTAKIFYSGALPATFPGSICDQHPAGVVCEIAYKTQMTQAAITSFVSSIPSSRDVVLVYHQEPEGDYTSGSQFITEWEQQAGFIRTAAAGAPNIFVADNAGGYNYGTGRLAADCSYVAPGADIYLEDHYMNPTDGLDMAHTAGIQASIWTNFLSCVNQVSPGAPVGIGEYAANSGAKGFDPTAPAVASMITADDAYLKTITGNPVFWWANWYDHTLAQGDYAPWSAAGISAWKAAEAGN